MRNLFVSLLVAALAAAPAAFAHTNGVPAPRIECETSWWSTMLPYHEYAGATGGTNDWPAPRLAGARYAVVDGSEVDPAADCDANTLTTTPDRHAEFGVGSALFFANGDSFACYGFPSDHYSAGTFRVEDDVFGPAVTFFVGADRVDLTGQSPCGDGLIDEWYECIGECPAVIAPGLDGAFVVLIMGTGGHISLG